MTLDPWTNIVDIMDPRDPSDDGEDEDTRPERKRDESVFIHKRLQRLAKELGVTQAELGRILDIKRQVLNPYFTGARGAGVQIIRRAAAKSGRTVAWMLGEDAGRAVIGTSDAQGNVIMTTTTRTEGIVALPEACGPLEAGSQLFVDPCSQFIPNKYLIVRTRAGAEWIAWARQAGDAKILDRLNGEAHIYSEGPYEILYVIVGTLREPPPPLSA